MIHATSAGITVALGKGFHKLTGMALLNVTHSHLTGKDVCRMGSH